MRLFAIIIAVTDRQNDNRPPVLKTMNPNGRLSGIEDLDITKQELDNIGEALKNEEFRKLLCEYVDEINDPENRALYEREIEQYERERGTAVQFVRPVPGYVVKTSADGVRKVFVNICACDVLQKPISRRVGGGDHWSLPNCLSPAREDYDNARKPCDVFDVIFHPDVLELAKRGDSLKNMVEDTALSMIEKNNDVVLDKTNLKYPKISYKGFARPLVIRNQIKDFQQSAEPESTELPEFPYKPPVDRPVQHLDLGTLKQKSLFTVPKYVIKQRTDIDIQEHGYNMNCKMNAAIPKELIVEINLPLLDSSANVELDVLPKSLKLICHKPSKYKLEIDLPYNVKEEDGNATFDQSTKKLIVTLPVLRKIPSLVYAKSHVTEIEMSTDEKCVNGHEIGTVYNDVETIADIGKNNVNGHEDKIMNGNEILVTNEHLCDGVVDTKCNSNGNVVENDVHYSLPEHTFIYGNKCILRFDVKNVDPTSINVIVISDKNLISGKFHSMGSGYFPLWFSFCIQIPSKSSLFKSEVKVLPTDLNVILEFFLNIKLDCKQYLYGLNENSLTIQGIRTETLKENSKSLANGVSIVSNDSDDDGDVLDDKEEIELKGDRVQDTKKNDDSCQCKDKNSKTAKERRKKKGKNIKKSNAIPIVGANSISQSEKKLDFIPGSLPIELNMRPTIVSIFT